MSFWQGDFRVHTYRLSLEGPEQEMIDGAGEDEQIAACDQWILPASSLEGVSAARALRPSHASPRGRGGLSGVDVCGMPPPAFRDVFFGGASFALFTGLWV